MTAMVLLSSWMASQVEFWKPIPGIPDYDVSSFGRIRSWRTVGHRDYRRKEPRTLKPTTDKYGYVHIKLQRFFGSKGISVTIHRLVAQSFVPNPENLEFVNHQTGFKGDNRADGLTWVTKSENSRHAWANGLHKRDRFAMAKKMVDARKAYRPISDDMVRMIRNMLADGISQGQIRRWSGMKASTIQSIAVGRTYRDIA